TVVLPQTDGRIVVGGSFSGLAGQARQNLARLYADGSIDPSFISTSISFVDCVATLPDGRFLVGGSVGQRDNFLSVLSSSGCTNRSRIGRLNSDGSIDSSFNPNADNAINSLAIQTDGAIVVAGTFTAIGGANRSRIARLDTNGVADPWFNPTAAGTSATVSC